MIREIVGNSPTEPTVVPRGVTMAATVPVLVSSDDAGLVGSRHDDHAHAGAPQDHHDGRGCRG